MRVVVKKSNPRDIRATDQDVEAAMKIFKRRVTREGVLQECRKREYYVKPGVKRRLKHENALKEKRKATKNKKY